MPAMAETIPSGFTFEEDSAPVRSRAAADRKRLLLLISVNSIDIWQQVDASAPAAGFTLPCFRKPKTKEEAEKEKAEAARAEKGSVLRALVRLPRVRPLLALGALGTSV